MEQNYCFIKIYDLDIVFFVSRLPWHQRYRLARPRPEAARGPPREAIRAGLIPGGGPLRHAESALGLPGIGGRGRPGWTRREGGQGGEAEGGQGGEVKPGEFYVPECVLSFRLVQVEENIDHTVEERICLIVRSRNVSSCYSYFCC